MGDTFRAALRQWREIGGWSLDQLARRAFVSKSWIHFVEKGKRAPNLQFAKDCDDVLGTAPLLTTILGLQEGDGVRRRALLSILGTAAAISVGAGTAAFAEVVRYALEDAVDTPADWDRVVDDFNRRLFLEPSPELGDALLGQIIVGRQVIAETGDLEAMRGMALLSMLYGLWLGDHGLVPAAHGWYATSTVLADRSGDVHARTYIRGRTATRGMYEGMPDRLVQARIGQALALSRQPSLGALEAHAASVQMAALTGDITGGRESVKTMWHIADKLPAAADDGPGPAQRAASFEVYLEGRTGTLSAARNAFEHAEPVLRSVPLWHAEAQVYYGRAMVRGGEVADGVAYALAAISALPFASRVVRMGVSDLLNVVPADYRSSDVDALRSYAAAGPGPWEAIA